LLADALHIVRYRFVQKGGRGNRYVTNP